MQADHSPFSRAFRSVHLLARFFFIIRRLWQRALSQMIVFATPTLGNQAVDGKCLLLSALSMAFWHA
jgi:hypothetical protein